MGSVFRASSQESGNPASQARLDDNGWCSGQLATNIFDPYIEIDFGNDVLFTSVTFEGVDSSFIERYRVQVAGEDGRHKFVTPTINSSQPEPAVSISQVECSYALCVAHRYSHWDRIGLVMTIDTRSRYLDQ